ncbi:E3 ubiquitin-protein ligase COP1 [Picochlorum sp. SENEW3]|nr:E3 ubiquitin-protein ligase COP1 [Picochlorum sp. SENEW3]
MLVNEDDLKCPICISLLVDPFVTPCGHAFCYSCVATHLKNSSTCPNCSASLTMAKLNPSFALSKIVNSVSKDKQHTESPFVSLKNTLSHVKHKLSVEEIDSLLKQLHEYKVEADREEKRNDLDLLLHFLQESRVEKAKRLEMLQKEIECLESDIHVVENSHQAVADGSMHRSKSVKSLESNAMTESNPPQDDTGDGKNRNGYSQNMYDTFAEHPGLKTYLKTQGDGDDVRSHPGGKQVEHHLAELCCKKRKRIASQFEDLQNVYLKLRSGRMGENHSSGNGQGTASISSDSKQGATVAHGDEGLQEFGKILGTLSQSNSLRVVAQIPRPPQVHPSSILSSVEYDRQGRLFATAGVSKRISIFDHTTMLESTGVMTHCPVVEMLTRSKLSCLSWNRFVASELASTDYEGVLNIWDSTTGDLVHEYEAHSKRIWSVDHCGADPAMLVTGSDDCHVKIWSTKSPSAIAQFNLKANVCAVKWHPNSPHQVAVGSADHSVYLYDLRKYDTYIRAFSGHKKAVSYVRWSGLEEIVSASTDSSLRLWNTAATSAEERIFRGHRNEKNFVGLGVRDNFFACGSETHEVYVYYKPLSKPITKAALPVDTSISSEVKDKPFISAVSWHPSKQELLAATSQGSVFVLCLQGNAM